MRKSLKEYISALGYWGLIVITPIILDIVGVYQLASGNQFTGIPSWVWFQVAFVFLLIIPFIAFHKVRMKRDEIQKQLKDKAKKKEIKTQLGIFMAKCQELKRKCAEEDEPPSKFREDLAKEMSVYLLVNLGLEYLARINSVAGQLAISVHVKHAQIWLLCNKWEIHLNEFLAELKD